EPDGVGAARALRRGPLGRRRSGGRHPLPLRVSARGRHLGRPALERHRLSARLLPEVSPVREVLPALGARSLPERSIVTGPRSAAPYPLPLRGVEALGRLTLDVVQSLGQFGTFLARTLALIFVPPFTLGRL